MSVVRRKERRGGEEGGEDGVKEGWDEEFGEKRIGLTVAVIRGSSVGSYWSNARAEVSSCTTQRRQYP